MARNSPLQLRGPMRRRSVKFSPKSANHTNHLVRLATLGGVTVAIALGACKARTRSAGGEVSRNWQPPKQETYMGVPAAEVSSAIQTRLAAAPPTSVTADQWKHVKKLYGTFNQTLLWLDDKGVHQPRVTALLNCGVERRQRRHSAREFSARRPLAHAAGARR